MKVNSNTVVETQRLLIKPISIEYAQSIFEEFTSEITTFMFPKTPDKIEETIEFVENSLKRNEEGSNFQTVIIDKFTNEFIGCAGVDKINSNTPELGIWIKKSKHNNAYGREVIFKLVNWTKKNLGIDYLIYPVDKRNYASKRIPELLGGKIINSYEEENQAGKLIKIVVYKI